MWCFPEPLQSNSSFHPRKLLICSGLRRQSGSRHNPHFWSIHHAAALAKSSFATTPYVTVNAYRNGCSTYFGSASIRADGKCYQPDSLIFADDELGFTASVNGTVATVKAWTNRHCSGNPVFAADSATEPRACNATADIAFFIAGASANGSPLSTPSLPANLPSIPDNLRKTLPTSTASAPVPRSGAASTLGGHSRSALTFLRGTD
ncbi:hypothetical protein DFJ73DRAFT_788161 [Zopfochytrium polystomum]|nr:hypothetical protein DFJ73DRAFT_788161 [Zopfochytrium polystomum]